MELGNLISRVHDIIEYLIILVAGLALLAFFWGLTKFIYKTGNEKEKDEGKNIMIWGTIALFVMVSVWGIISMMQSDLGLNTGVILELDRR
jgi:hypothetical protein